MVGAAMLGGFALAQGHFKAIPGAPDVHQFQVSSEPIAPGGVLRVGLGFAGFKQDAAEAFVAAQNDPKNVLFHQWISTTEFGNRFGASDADVQAVSSYLNSMGFTDVRVSPTKSYISGSCTVALAEKTFGTRMTNYVRPAAMVAKGEPKTFFGPATPVMMPTALAPKISGAFGLCNLPYMHPQIKKAAKRQKGGGYVPSQLAIAYNSTVLQGMGYNGQDMNIAIFSPTDRSYKDPVDFGLDLKITGTSYYDVEVNGGPSNASGSEEAALDIETIMGQAPNSNIFIIEPSVGSGALTDYMTGELDGYDTVGLLGNCPIMSSSWDLEEAAVIAAGEKSYATTFSNVCMGLSASGVTIFNSSGDAAGYSNTSPYPVTTKLETSCPYVTSVGGTTLHTTSANVFSTETLWAYSFGSKGPVGGGGGISKIYATPSWQTGPGVKNSHSNGFRQVPDISANADPATGYGIVSGGSVVVVGGTSASTPLWAANVLLMEQYYGTAAGKPVRLGLLNPALYTLGTDFENSSLDVAGFFYLYHDIASGSNGVYATTAGYDIPSGWGSADFDKMWRDLGWYSGVSKLAPDFQPYTPSGWKYPLQLHTSTTSATEPTSFSHTVPVYWGFGVENTGSADGAPSTFDCEVDGKVVASGAYAAIPMGAAVTYLNGFQYTFTAGTHTVSFIINYGNKTRELSTTNNTYTRTIKVS